MEKQNIKNNSIENNETKHLASLFSNAANLNSKNTLGNAYLELEEGLNISGFSLVERGELNRIFNNQNLVCRSENFGNVLDLILKNKTIEIKNFGGEANMCSMMSGQGFKIALQEGFSGREVGGIIKVVITFKPDNLVKKTKVEKDSHLWAAKSETAEVSLVGNGFVKKEDLEMVSFRLPKKYFPENLLSEEEIENDNILFIIRHYKI